MEKTIRLEQEFTITYDDEEAFDSAKQRLEEELIEVHSLESTKGWKIKSQGFRFKNSESSQDVSNASVKHDV